MAKQKRDVPWLGRRGGVYYAFWYDDDTRQTRRFSLRTRERDQAQGRFAAFLVEGCEIWKSTRSQGSAELTVGRLLDDYFDEHIQVKAVDKGRVEIAIRHLKVHFDNIPVSQVDIPLSRAYVRAREQGVIGGKVNGKRRTGSAGTIRRELGVLIAAINHGVAWKRLKPEQVPKIEQPDAPEPKGRWLSHDELRRLRAAATGRVRWFIEIAYYTAARRRSVETLTWFQVDMERMRINLSKPDEVRTKKRRPVVPIDPELAPVLRQLDEEKKSTFVLGGNGNIRKAFATAVEKAKLVDVTPHTLRHTRATHLLQSGASPWAVAGLLGDTVQTVLDTYGHHCPDYLAEVLGPQKMEGEDVPVR